MSMTDPIADYITRIRNAGMARHATVDVPESKLKLNITMALVKEKFIDKFVRYRSGRQNYIRIYLKYTSDGKPVIEGLQRVSTPGRRLYYGADEIPRVLNGLGIMIMTTPKGVVTDKDARRMRVGGEPLCTVW